MTGSPTPDQDDEARQAHERLVLPLVVPALLFLFAVLVVYGLSRIYIDLNTWHYKTVSMATPLAIGVALTILLISTYLAGRPVPRWQVGFIVLLAAGGLTGGATWAAIHTEPVRTPPANASATPSATVQPGAIAVTLHDNPFQVTASPASHAPGTVTFSVANTGSITHNFRVVKTTLDPAKLPIDASGFQVDETQVAVVASGKDLDPGKSEPVTANNLQAGSYVLFCNIPSHYQSGMHVQFTVQ